MNIDQLKQRLAETNFIVTHHSDLSKAYLREVFLIEQAIANQESAKSNEVLEAVNPEDNEEQH